MVDSVEEIRKVQSVKADAKMYLRIDAPNIGSDWPLAGKFGAHMHDVPELIQAAVDCKADLAGVTFHVGSQCLNPENWRVGMERARKVFASMRAVGLKPRLLNLGGGYPVRHVKPIPSIETIAERDQQGAAPLRPRDPGDRRAGPLPRLRRRLLHLPRGGHRHPQRPALDVLGRGRLRRRDRDHRGPALQHLYRPRRRARRRGTWPAPRATRWTW